MAQPTRSIQEIDAEWKQGIRDAVAHRSQILHNMERHEENGNRLDGHPQGYRDLVAAETAAQAARNRFIQACTSAGITNWQETDEGREANDLVELHREQAEYLERAQDYLRDVADHQFLRETLPPVGTPFQPQARHPGTTAVQSALRHHSRPQRNLQTLHTPSRASASSSSRTQRPVTRTLLSEPNDRGYSQLRAQLIDRRHQLYEMDGNGKIYQLSRARDEDGEQ